jgi:hypothetical protein
MMVPKNSCTSTIIDDALGPSSGIYLDLGEKQQIFWYHIWWPGL